MVLSKHELKERLEEEVDNKLSLSILNRDYSLRVTHRDKWIIIEPEPQLDDPKHYFVEGGDGRGTDYQEYIGDTDELITHVKQKFPEHF